MRYRAFRWLHNGCSWAFWAVILCLLVISGLGVLLAIWIMRVLVWAEEKDRDMRRWDDWIGE